MPACRTTWNYSVVQASAGPLIMMAMAMGNRSRPRSVGWKIIGWGAITVSLNRPGNRMKLYPRLLLAGKSGAERRPTMDRRDLSEQRANEVSTACKTCYDW